jgi:hypothetical protein
MVCASISTCFRAGTRVAALSGFLFVIGLSRGALANSAPAGPCHVAIDPSDAAPAWAAAGIDVSRRIAEADSSQYDCREVVIRVDGQRASATLYTRDGRQATRPVRSPEELAATVIAMASTVASAEPSAVQASSAQASPMQPTDADRLPAPDGSPSTGSNRLQQQPTSDHAQSFRHDAASSAEDPVRSDDDPRRVLVGVAAGGRVGVPNRVLGFVFGATAGVTIRRWELLVGFDLEPEATPGIRLPRKFSMSTMNAGAAVGLRQPIGSIALVAGVLAGASLSSEEGRLEQTGARGEEHDNVGGVVAEPRLGLYSGLVWPSRTRVRMRAQVVLDTVPTRFAQSRVLDPALPPLSAWSVSLLLGAEGHVL